MWTRAGLVLLASLLAAVSAGCKRVPAAPADADGADATADAGAGTPFVYVGSRDGRITVYRPRLGDGALTLASIAVAGDFPSFLAADPRALRLYATNEAAGAVAAFAIEPRTGALTFTNRVPAGGAGTTYVALDRAGQHVLVANYDGRTAGAFVLGPAGTLGGPTGLVEPGIHPHQILTDPTDRYAYVPCTGSDWIAQYNYTAASGALVPHAVPRVAAARGAGPRHLAFHPAAPFVYVINELDSTVAVYAFDAASGVLTALPAFTVSTLPAGYTGRNAAAELAFAPSGRFLYGSNRGHDSIVVYAVDAATGRLTPVAYQPTGGRTPRSFGIDPTGVFLFVANQDSNTVVTFAIDPDRGTLRQTSATGVASAPYWVGVVALPGA